QAFPSWLAQCTAALQVNPSGRVTKAVALGQIWSFGITSFSLGNTLLAPNPRYPNCTQAGGNNLQTVGMYGLSSYHPGGANVLMCDGSVRFLKDSTNMQTVWKLGSRDQGEVVSADEF